MKALVIAEHDTQKINHNTASLISALSPIASQIDVLIAGDQIQPIAQEAIHLAGIHQVLCADAPCYAHLLDEPLSALVQACGSDYDYLVSAASTFGKNLMPRIAAILGVAALSDVIAVDSPDTFTRPIYAGNALIKVQSHDRVKVLTLRSSAFKPLESSSKAATIQNVDFTIDNTNVKFIKQTLSTSDRPELTSADIGVSGGRGVGSRDNFALIEKLANALGAAVGASRAAVDAQYVSNDYQVGQTGKVVAPKLYVAVGISGAIQHLAGMQDSQVIVAINQDEEATIMQMADYSLVADLFEAVPQLIEQLTE